MYNRYINVKRDFHLMNEYANNIEKLIINAQFDNEEDKQKVIDWARKTFFNQWKRKGQQK
tara:strand:+ start:383 stop:562 length:180 start_codon:yes stop_codon:yes gene_type:complete